MLGDLSIGKLWDEGAHERAHHQLRVGAASLEEVEELLEGACREALVLKREAEHHKAEHLGGGGGLPLDEEHQRLHELFDELGRLSEVLAVLRLDLGRLVGIRVLHELELVARVLHLDVEHDAAPRVNGHELEQVLLHRLHHVQALLGLVEAAHQLGCLLEDLDRDLLAEVHVVLLRHGPVPHHGRRLLDTAALLQGGHLVAVEADELDTVGDEPDPVGLDLVDEGVVLQRDVLELLLLEHGHLLVERLLVPGEGVVVELQGGELLQRRVLKVLPPVTARLRVRPRADAVMRQVEVRQSLEAREVRDAVELVVAQVEVLQPRKLLDGHLGDLIVRRPEHLEGAELLEPVQHQQPVVRQVELLERGPFDRLQPLYRAELEVGVGDDDEGGVAQLVQLLMPRELLKHVSGELDDDVLRVLQEVEVTRILLPPTLLLLAFLASLAVGALSRRRRRRRRRRRIIVVLHPSVSARHEIILVEIILVGGVLAAARLRRGGRLHYLERERKTRGGPNVWRGVAVVHFSPTFYLQY